MAHTSQGAPASQAPSSATGPEFASQLVARLEQGDATAESELIERYGRGVAMILDRHTRDPAEAQDLYQEALATALVKLRNGELREPSRLAAFLAAIARNMAIEHYRKAIRRRTDADSEATDAAVDQRPESPLGGLLRSENAALVRQTVAELNNARDREILYRFYLADEDKDLIAADLGLESLQFNRVLHRARQRYKTHFQEALKRREMGRASVHGVAWLTVLVLCWATGGPRSSPQVYRILQDVLS